MFISSFENLLSLGIVILFPCINIFSLKSINSEKQFAKQTLIHRASDCEKIIGDFEEFYGLL